MNAHLLSLLILLPFFGAFVVAFLPRQATNTLRATSVIFMLVELVASIWLFDGDYSTAAYQFVEQYEWIPTLGISYKLGVDGI